MKETTDPALRGGARLAAVQAIYQMGQTQVPSKSVVFEFRNHRFGHEEEAGYDHVDEGLFEAIVSGIVSDQAEIDAQIGGRLSERWRLDRLDATLRAILRAATWEMVHRPDIPGRVVIDEYTNIAARFFDAKETDFVNALLDRTARELRDWEMTPQNPA